jgi:hypothetical protein
MEAFNLMSALTDNPKKTIYPFPDQQPPGQKNAHNSIFLLCMATPSFNRVRKNLQICFKNTNVIGYQKWYDTRPKIDFLIITEFFIDEYGLSPIFLMKRENPTLKVVYLSPFTSEFFPSDTIKELEPDVTLRLVDDGDLFNGLRRFVANHV